MIGLKGRSFAIAILGGLLAATQATAQLVPTPGPDGIVHLSRHANPPECLTPTAGVPAPTPTASSEPAPTPIATPVPTPAPAPVPNRIAVAVPTYSAWSANVGPGANSVENGTMSGGIGARGALVAVSARAGGDGSLYCRRDGRSQAMIDACLKNFANR
ncbi:hypothetical protein [Methylobacterium brachiatum]